MSKESQLGQQCVCGNNITFMEQHVPHCPGLAGNRWNRHSNLPTPELQVVDAGKLQAEAAREEQRSAKQARKKRGKRR